MIKDIKIVKNIKIIIVNSIYSISISIITSINMSIMNSISISMMSNISISIIISMSIIINISIIIALTLIHARTPLAPHPLNNHYHHLLLRRLREDTRAMIGAKIGIDITWNQKPPYGGCGGF